jgi:hypothetical protein
MAITQKDAQRPKGSPKGDHPKEKLDEPFAPDEPQGEGDKVGGRDVRMVAGRMTRFWHYGPYVWLCDG